MHPPHRASCICSCRSFEAGAQFVSVFGDGLSRPASRSQSVGFSTVLAASCPLLANPSSQSAPSLIVSLTWAANPAYCVRARGGFPIGAYGPLHSRTAFAFALLHAAAGVAPCGRVLAACVECSAPQHFFRRAAPMRHLADFEAFKLFQ